jgi:polysaccharide export outer membrane protein
LPKNIIVQPLSCLLSVLLLLAGCAPSEPVSSRISAQPVPSQLSAKTKPTDLSPAPASFSGNQEEANNQALEALWRSRTAAASVDKASPEFTLGPGDILQISIPQIPQLGNRVERVSESDTISLPLLGEINVAGMTQEDLLHALSQRTAKYVHHPQVDVFIQHTEARQVAVIGAVKTPGRYSLASKSDTIMTMIGRAGGMTDTAASRIILLPGSGRLDTSSAPADTTEQPGQIANAAIVPATFDPQKSSESDFGQALRRRIVISTTSAADQRYLDLPAKPGDVILIPTAGEVTVQGWVDKPGAFHISPGMTVLSSIAAAGGAVFTNSATLLREQDNGQKTDIPIDLAKVKSGAQPDVQVQSGDVVVVERSAIGAIPYTFYFLVQKVGIGIAATPIF